MTVTINDVSNTKSTTSMKELHKISDENCQFLLFQNTSGTVPRPYLTSILSLHILKSFKNDDPEQSNSLNSLLEKSLQWYLDNSGRLNKLELQITTELDFKYDRIESQLSKMGMELIANNWFKFNTEKLRSYCIDQSKIEENNHLLFDIIGRLSHELGNPTESIDWYTKALIINPKSASIFRNLGAAYQASGNSQMTFASYQQAIQLDPSDVMVYLKLAMFYEDFAAKDWPEADSNAQKCYEYYLEKVDPADTSILTRLGNLLLRDSSKADQAISVYDRTLAVDSSLHNVWFNKAHAQLKLYDYEGAKHSLQMTIQLNPEITAAKHMLKALVEDEAIKATSLDQNYVVNLFNDYAPNYDTHIKKLLYATPRVIRQELAKIYKSRYSGQLLPFEEEILPPVPEIINTDNDKDILAPPTVFIQANTPVGSSCQTYTSFMNNSLDILDLGCGTGLAGSWLKDYAKYMIGVDMSDQMAFLAKKKTIYQDVIVKPVFDYLIEVNKKRDKNNDDHFIKKNTFDVVVAADFFAYIGELKDMFREISKFVRRNGGIFAFTVESVDADYKEYDIPNGYRLQKSGRFGYSKKYIDNIISSQLGPEFNVT
eukprot:gene8615-11648_t